MIKYKLQFSLARIDDDNEFLEHEVGKFNVTLPLENIEQLTALMFQEARTQVNDLASSESGHSLSSSNPPSSPSEYDTGRNT